MLSNPKSYQEPLLGVVNLGWAYQVQQKQDLKWFKPSKSSLLQTLLSSGQAAESGMCCTLSKKTPDSAWGMGFKVWLWMGFLRVSRQARAPRFLQVFGHWCLCSLEIPVGRSQSRAAGAPQGPWGHLGKGPRPHTPSSTGLKKSCVWNLRFSQPQSTVPAVLPFLSRPSMDSKACLAAVRCCCLGC